MTALIEYFAVPLEFLDSLAILVARHGKQALRRAWALAGLPLATLLLNIENIQIQASRFAMNRWKYEILPMSIFNHTINFCRNNYKYK